MFVAMKVATIVLLTFCGVAHAARFTTWDKLETSGYDFHAFVAEYGKNYGEVGSDEWQNRRSVFQTNLEAVLRHNREQHTWKAGINALSDLTDAEFGSLLGYARGAPANHAGRRDFVSVAKPEDLPASVDWRKAMTPVKDQGHCGSCWTFAASEAIESHWFLKTGQLVDLSEQQIASCVNNPQHCGGYGGCRGGTAPLAFQGIIDAGGIMSEWMYAYASYGGEDYPCRVNASTSKHAFAAHVESFVSLPPNQYWPIVEALATVGPLAVNVDASAWRTYESGVFDGCNQTNPELNHVVLLAGYGTDPLAGDYWLVRNSWSASYGEGGYIRLKRQHAPLRCGLDLQPSEGVECDPQPVEQTVCGTCGIWSDSSYPVVGIPKGVVA